MTLPDLYDLTAMVTHNTASHVVVMKPDLDLGMAGVFHTVSHKWLLKTNELRLKYPGIRIQRHYCTKDASVVLMNVQKLNPTADECT